MFKLEMNFSAPDFEKAIMKAAVQGVAERVKRIRCPKHGEYARLNASGNNLKNLKMSVSGCCDELTKLVREKF